MTTRREADTQADTSAGEILGERQKLGPPNGSDDPCVSRLVAKFLLSCTPSVGQQ